MSGQPYRYASDVENFRSDYMDQLNLKATIDDMNLKANQVYKASGQLPPQSSMPDTRTTAEKLADTLRIKTSLIAELKPIAGPQFAQAVIQEVEKSNLNSNGSLFIFFAQNVKEIVRNLQKKYALGIVGNANDALNFRLFIENMYNQTKELTGSVQSAFNRPYSSNKHFNAGDLKQMNDIFDTLSVQIATKWRNHPEINRLIQSIHQIINDIRELLPTNQTVIDIKEYFKLQGDANNIGFMNELENFITSLPLIPTVYSAYEHLKKSIINQTDASVIDNLTRIRNLFPKLEEVRRLQRFKDKSIPPEFFEHDIDKKARDEPSTQLPSKMDLSPDEEDFFSDLYSGSEGGGGGGGGASDEASPTSISGNIETQQDKFMSFLRDQYENVNDIMGLDIPDKQKQTELKIIKLRIETVWKHISGSLPGYQLKELGNPYDELHTHIRNAEDKLIQGQSQAGGGAEYELKQGQTQAKGGAEIKKAFKDMTPEEKRIRIESGTRVIPRENIPPIGPGGNGLKRGRGRPKGSGISHNFQDKVDTSKGIQPDRRYISFGKYLINNSKLNEGTVSLRTPKGVNVIGYPSQRVTPQLSNVFKKIVGGGVPSFKDLTDLNDEERNYLYNVSKKAEILDKLSIPSPSKDQEDKDIHDFQVMKGEILSGNDNKDLIKKFKIHMSKMVRAGTLPKKEVADIMTDLIELGF